ncbi:hypothetical protein HMPREF1624_05570 [Sporothrix schenckii ATCC 58251]|uniref:HTH myb-type domain-containing protein n=1 Tax=Sporothrix schenckii (strain ATCC 58251 / de Perez 2211183) TaxID=1391915 RepID=U7PP66_SPOS1|nr:hypothetical protein HMPREF1624_05570 [Sporothrix schenckii ATCC 58251]
MHYPLSSDSSHTNDLPLMFSAQHQYQQHLSTRRNDQPIDFRYGQQPPQAPGQQHHTGPGQPPLNVQPQHSAPHAAHPGQQHQQQPPQSQQPQQHQQAPPPSQQQPATAAVPAPAPTPVAQRARKRPNPATAQPPSAAASATSASPIIPPPIPTPTVPNNTVSAVPPPAIPAGAPLTKPPTPASASATGTPIKFAAQAEPGSVPTPPAKKSRTNTPWTPAEEHRLKQMRDAGSSWAEIAKTFPTRTEGSVKKHWYKDMHYAEFAEDESQALLNAIKEYENQKWKVIGQKVGKPAKACEQYAKEHFADQILSAGKR